MALLQRDTARKVIAKLLRTTKTEDQATQAHSVEDLNKQLWDFVQDA